MQIGFDNNKYFKTQSQHIRERIAKFGGKLYLEFGGKLFDDYHASRVLPGFEPDSKITMLYELRDQAEIVVAINAADIEVTFDGEKLTIPAVCISDRSTITVTITGPNGTTVLDDWTVKEVKRPKKAGCDEFVVTLVSKLGKEYKHQDGETITIKVVPVAEAPDEYIEFTFKVTAVKKVVVFNGISGFYRRSSF